MLLLGLLWGSEGEVGAASLFSGRGPTVVHGVPVVPLPTVAKQYGCKLDDAGLALTRTGISVRFEEDSRRVRVDDTVVWLHRPLLRVRRGWGVPEADRAGALDPLFRPVRHLASHGSRVVVLDPGHGGEDDGTRGGRGTREKDLTLDVCRRLASQLATAGVQVRLTRDGDRTLSLADRSRFAAQAKADLFLSVHFNAAGNDKAAGVETYLMPMRGQHSTSDGADGPGDARAYSGNRSDGANAYLAYVVHRRLVKTLGAEDRGVRRARFAVLREAPCPAVLIECGFLSNAGEEAKIRSPHYLQAISASIAAGTRDYLRAVRRAQAPTP